MNWTAAARRKGSATSGAWSRSVHTWSRSHRTARDIIHHCTLLLEAVQGIRAHVLVKLCSDTVATPVSDSHLGCAFHRVKRRYQYVSQERDGGPACRLMALSIITCVKNGHIVPRKLLPPVGHRAVLATSTSTCLNWQSHRSVCQSQRGVAASQPCPERWLTKRIRRA